ncbi:MAG TPA: SIS domain-containing protein [Patescibacteria group bacterium]|nr:SIS domain-containing protein [Patescibacteria group bacterium]
MKNLTDITAIKKLDPQNTLGSTDLLTEQLKTAWSQVNAFDIQPLVDIQTIIFCGMGASIYGALVVKSLLGSHFKYPTEIVTDYHLPFYVNEHTLVVLTSYSGTTEEVLSCAQEALVMKAHMLILTKGGALAEFAKQNNIPAYIFDGALNLSGVPRLGTGYTILGLIGLLNKSGIVAISEDEINSAITRLQSKTEIIKQQAMTDAPKFVGKIPVIFAAEHLSGNGQILRNQFNETSKTFSAFYLVPDLNHHLMEGLQFPQPSPLHFIVLDSKNYSAKISKRMSLTIDVVKKNKQIIDVYKPDTISIYDDFLQTLSYGSYLTLYLGLLYDQNPAVNPWVDYFKDQLKK